MNLVPGTYRHYKGALYVVLGMARHHETRAEQVIYFPVESHDGELPRLNVRPLVGTYGDEDGWITPVEIDGQGIPRFVLVSPMALYR